MMKNLQSQLMQNHKDSEILLQKLLATLQLFFQGKENKMEI